MSEYFIVSAKHTKKTDKYVTFWRPDNAGYCWPLSWAGRYTSAVIEGSPDYYNNVCDSFCVPCEEVMKIAISPEPNTVDGDAAPVVQNNKDNWARLRAASLKDMTAQ